MDSDADTDIVIGLDIRGQVLLQQTKIAQC